MGGVGGEGDSVRWCSGATLEGLRYEVGFEEKFCFRVKEAEATSSGEHLHRHEGIQNKANGSIQSTYRSARKSFVRRFASTHMSPAADGLLRKHELCWKVCWVFMFEYNTVRALCRRPRGGRLSGTCSLKAAARQSGSSVSRPPQRALKL